MSDPKSKVPDPDPPKPGFSVPYIRILISKINNEGASRPYWVHSHVKFYLIINLLPNLGPKVHSRGPGVMVARNFLYINSCSVTL